MNLRLTRCVLWFCGSILLACSAAVIAVGVSQPIDLMSFDEIDVPAEEFTHTNKLIEKKSLPLSAYESAWNKRLRMPAKKQPPKVKKVKNEKPPPKLEVELVGTIIEGERSEAIFKAKIDRRSKMVFVGPGEMINEETQLLRLEKENAWVYHFGQVACPHIMYQLL